MVPSGSTIALKRPGQLETSTRPTKLKRKRSPKINQYIFASFFRSIFYTRWGRMMKRLGKRSLTGYVFWTVCGEEVVGYMHVGVDGQHCIGPLRDETSIMPLFRYASFLRLCIFLVWCLLCACLRVRAICFLVEARAHQPALLASEYHVHVLVVLHSCWSSILAVCRQAGVQSDCRSFLFNHRSSSSSSLRHWQMHCMSCATT